MADPTPTIFRVIAWAPFFERAKFRYWKDVGRGTITVGKDGKPRAEFYYDAHVSGGSIRARLLPEGEMPEDQPGEAQEQKRPTRPQDEHDDP